MDDLLDYLQSNDCYDEYELEQILDTKIIITKDHIENIDLLNYGADWDFDIINLFKKYGYNFTNDDYILLVNENGYILDDIPDDKKTNEICKNAVKQSGHALEYVPEDKKQIKYVKWQFNKMDLH